MDQKHKIFVKKAVAARIHYDFSANRYPRETEIPEKTVGRIKTDIEVDRQQEADCVVLKMYGPPGVVINENMEILQFRGPIGQYVDAVPGRVSLNLLKIAKKDFVAELRIAVDQARKTHMAVKRKSVGFRRNGQLRSVDISVEPLDQQTRTSNT